eukprot:g6491.t1
MAGGGGNRGSVMNSTDYTTCIQTTDTNHITSLWWNIENSYTTDHSVAQTEEELQKDEKLLHGYASSPDSLEGGEGDTSEDTETKKRTRSRTPSKRKSKKKKSSKKKRSSSSGESDFLDDQAEKVSKTKDIEKLMREHHSFYDKEGDDDVKDDDGCWVLLPLSAILSRPDRYARKPGYWTRLDESIKDILLKIKRLKERRDSSRLEWETLKMQANEGDGTELDIDEIHSRLVEENDELRRVERRLRRLRQAQ